MEACGSAHHWGRAIRDLRHEARLIPALRSSRRNCRRRRCAASAPPMCGGRRRAHGRGVSGRSYRGPAPWICLDIEKLPRPPSIDFDDGAALADTFETCSLMRSSMRRARGNSAEARVIRRSWTKSACICSSCSTQRYFRRRGSLLRGLEVRRSERLRQGETDFHRRADHP